jgi:hypothetical protein
MTTINPVLLEQVAQRYFHNKNAFVDAGMASGAAPMMPPGGGMPPGPGMPPGQGMPPMDPAMMGGGMPPGMPPGMDPSMMGGMPPMDPAMMGAPGQGGMDPAAGPLPPAPAAASPDGGSAPMPSGEAPSPLTEDRVRQLIQEAVAAGGAGGTAAPGGEAKPKKVDPAAMLPQLQQEMYQMKQLLVTLTKGMGLQLDPEVLLNQQQNQPQAEQAGAGQQGGGEKTAASCGYAGRGVPDSEVAAPISLRQTLTPSNVAKNANATLHILRARREQRARQA